MTEPLSPQPIVKAKYQRSSKYSVVIFKLLNRVLFESVISVMLLNEGFLKNLFIIKG